MTEKALAANHANGAKGGRPPSAFSEEDREEIYDAVRAGVPPEAAAGRLGISRSTLYLWLEKGRRENADEPYATFAAEVDKALADWETRDLLIIGRAAEKQWQAAAWRLERRLVERYGRRTRIDGQVTVVARPFVDLTKLSLDEQRMLRDLLLKAHPDEDAIEALPVDARPALELMPGPQADEAA